MAAKTSAIPPFLSDILTATVFSSKELSKVRAGWSLVVPLQRQDKFRWGRVNHRQRQLCHCLSAVV
jgi:hypothetical protein